MTARAALTTLVGFNDIIERAAKPIDLAID
jgi:hypothetical protein